MPCEIGMEYGYDRKTQGYHATIWVQLLPLRGRLFLQVLDGSFQDILCALSAALAEYEDVTRVQLSRTEVVESARQLSSEFIELLRTDPVALAKTLSHPDTTVVVRQAKTGLPIGVESLADTFGDRIYLRRVGLECECPGCGGWATIGRVGVLRCSACLFALPGVWHEDGWASVNTQALLDDHRPRYFLPRYWNPSRKWIGINDLLAMFVRFVKEREECNRNLEDNSE